jgi:glycerate dehydrogenase
MTNESKPNIVILDGHTLNPGDLSWAPLKALGRCFIYEYTPTELMVERCRPADIVIVNKAVLTAETIREIPHLKCICVTATGVNIVDLEAARERGVPVCNVVGYGAYSVAQHVFALLLALTNRVAEHNQSVHLGDWSVQRHFSYSLFPLVELAGKTMGIYGLGQIGRQAARIAQAFGMEVIAHHKHPQRDQMAGVRFVDLDTLFRESDVLSLHAPLTAGNAGLINSENLAKMKPTAYLINTGRGGLVDEPALEHALRAGLIAGAGLDVLAVEPPPAGHPFFNLPNCLITPHQAWATREARLRLLEETVENIRAFLRDAPRNIVN